MSQTSLLLVRHGERADGDPTHPWNRTRLPRPRDPPLTPKGHIQARLSASSLPVHSANIIYVSPLIRCLQTAAEFARFLKLPIKIVYSLAKPCAYFRHTLRRGLLPKCADLDEATVVMKKVWEGVEVVGYEEEDGRTCRQVLEALIEQEGAKDVLVVGHCESQIEMAKVAGVLGRMRTPFCGIAEFQPVRQRQGLSWKLVKKPERFEPQIKVDG